MPSIDKTCSGLILDAYNSTGKFITHLFSDTAHCFISYIDGDTYVVFPGTETAVDWALDLFAVPHDPIDDPKLGMVHAGFFVGAEGLYRGIKPYVKGKLYICGHSLGAARAWLCAGLFITGGLVPDGVVVFGSPRPGYQQLADILKALPYAKSYRNMNDIVTKVPFDFLMFPYIEPVDLIQLNIMPPPNDPWGIAAPHHLQLYDRGLS